MSVLDAFAGFSFGPRTCLGHKFAKVEAVCFLTLLLRDWRVETALEPGETRPGPLIVESLDTTVVVPPGWDVEGDEMGILELRRVDGGNQVEATAGAVAAGNQER